MLLRPRIARGHPSVAAGGFSGSGFCADRVVNGLSRHYFDRETGHQSNGL